MSKMFIYTLVDPISKQPRYLGCTKHPKKRYGEHINQFLCHSPKNYWIKELKSQGLKPDMRILAECNHDVWREAEREWFDRLIADGASLLNSPHHIKGGNIHNLPYKWRNPPLTRKWRK